MENLLEKELYEKELTIYGKDELEAQFENQIERNIFVTSLVKEFKHTADEITVMRMTNELIVVKIQENDKVTSRLYRRDGKYVEIPGGDSTEDALSILSVIKGNKQDLKQSEVVFPDNYGKYVKSLPDFVIPGKTLKMMQDYMYSNVNVLIKGGPGTGKTDFPQRLATTLGMKCLVVDCGTIKTPQDWFGTREYVEGEGTTFVQSELVEYLQQPSIIILDEINRTTPDCHNSIFRILDGNRQVHIMALKKTIKVHPHCIIIGTMNEGRSHTGTYMMDSAITDRFEMFTLDIPTEGQIVKLLSKKYPTVHRDYLDAIAKLTHKINKLYNDEQLNVQVGLRPALSACTLLARNNKLIDVLNQSFVGRFSSEGGADSEATLVRQAFTGIITKELLNSKNCDLQNSDNLYGEDEDYENNEYTENNEYDENSENEQ